eukprot:tig00020614_g12141.t1
MDPDLAFHKLVHKIQKIIGLDEPDATADLATINAALSAWLPRADPHDPFDCRVKAVYPVTDVEFNGMDHDGDGRVSDMEYVKDAGTNLTADFKDVLHGDHSGDAASAEADDEVEFVELRGALCCEAGADAAPSPLDDAAFDLAEEPELL